MKLPQLLSQFLYQTKRLDLPGIGTFTLDASATIPQESDRLGHVPASGITFKNANIPAADDTLITYIKEHTGKMKSLAAADLDFFLTTGRQLLNIGKPFYLEGIGTLLKNKDGRLDFTPGEYLIPKLEDLHHPERRSPGATSFDEPPREEPTGSNVRQTLLLIGLVGGLIVIAWGGYYLYKRNNYTESTAENRARVIPESTTTQRADTTTLSSAPATGSTGGQATAPKDTALARTTNPATIQPAPPTTVQHTPVPEAGQSLWRFVILQTPNKNHALRRYNQLLGYQLNIHMEQKDSSLFKLYFPIAAAIKDTTHIKDSLADVYAAHVSIEQ
ncbi:hypothetical protein [Puia dinghuensis]|uniref:CCDC81-like prokaryotic HU domain-containing protein n=1 Tax=Puia dinghuensis TaxID=1792502 RepID=A0A8J2UCX7_9BACT|nr:hypothetical protein [Puia dinghuensis]GGA97342.1 hypothetical protein GCM10011511_20860 [Puia dinghuensis]